MMTKKAHKQPLMPDFPLITLKIHHRTTYRYREPVSLADLRTMLRAIVASEFAPVDYGSSEFADR
jgi:hypothetical protein